MEQEEEGWEAEVGEKEETEGRELGKVMRGMANFRREQEGGGDEVKGRGGIGTLSEGKVELQIY